MRPSPDASAWTTLTLYGVTHSPWVEGVRLALSLHGLEARVTSYPHGLSWVVRQGLVFPALRLGDGRTLVDSFALYGALEEAGYALGVGRVAAADRERAQVALEKLFLAYAPGRCIRGRRWRFIVAWSRMRELPFSGIGVVSRALVSLYFWTLIRLGIHHAHRRGRPVYDLDAIAAQLQTWDAQLADAEWLTGSELGFLDLALLGHLQCMTSGLTEELVPVLRQQAHLMAWLERAVALLPHHEPLYVRRLLDDEAMTAHAGRGEQALFWAAWVTAVLAWPVSGAAILMLLLRRQRNPAHSGAVSTRVRRRERPQSR